MLEKKEIKKMLIDGQIYLNYKDLQQFLDLERHIPHEYINLQNIQLMKVEYELAQLR